MYAQLTTRCNLRCEHCMFSCTEVGEDMDDDVWEATLALAAQTHGYIALGGGEPTLHAQFLRYLYAAIGHPQKLGVTVITNGTNEALCMEMIDLYRRMRSHGELRFLVNISVDQWHDRTRQSNAALRAYAKLGLIAELDGEPAPEGRALTLPLNNRSTAYPRNAFLPSLRVTPRGLVTHYTEPSRSMPLGDVRTMRAKRTGWRENRYLADAQGRILLEWHGAPYRWNAHVPSFDKMQFADTLNAQGRDYLMKLVALDNYGIAVLREREHAVVAGQTR
jgi:hypothetical protein